MIAYLKGRVQHRGDRFIVLRVGDVGYRVFVGPHILGNVDVGKDLEMHIHDYIAENVNELYGFPTIEELDLFEMLLTVSGVGPKSALGVLSQGDAGAVKRAIIHGEADLLTKASGIGKKTAERIIVDLKNKMDVLDDGKSTLSLDEDDDAVAGLIRLGYSKKEAREALANVDPKVATADERVKQALKQLGQR